MANKTALEMEEKLGTNSKKYQLDVLAEKAKVCEFIQTPFDEY